MVHFLVYVDKLFFVCVLDLLSKEFLSLFKTEFINFDLFTLFRVLANDVAVKCFKENDYFYTLLVFDDLIKEIEKLLLILCIFHEAAARKAYQCEV